MRIVGGLGKAFGNAKAKLLATKFNYTLTIHNLSPWPQGHRAIAIGWQSKRCNWCAMFCWRCMRLSSIDIFSATYFHVGGKKKRGATRSVYPSTAPGRIGAVVRFNEKFDVSASLYKVGLSMRAMHMANMCDTQCSN